MSIDVNSKYTAELETSLGKIVIELFTDTSPITVNNFVNLSNRGYYNNLSFFNFCDSTRSCFILFIFDRTIVDVGHRV